jgi:hypothetical protein
MLGFRKVGTMAAVFALVANVAAAQSATQPPARDSLWNGTLIGLGAGLGSVAVLDAMFCDNGFGGCDFPWAASLLLGGIGAGAGAGIDFLIGSNERKTTVRLSPIIGRARQGVAASLLLPQPGSLPPLARVRQRATGRRGDSIWNGTLIGAGVGLGGGAVWGLKTCGANDNECFAIAGPVGMAGGAAIGAAVGAIADALHD